MKHLIIRITIVSINFHEEQSFSLAGSAFWVTIFCEFLTLTTAKQINSMKMTKEKVPIDIIVSSVVTRTRRRARLKHDLDSRVESRELTTQPRGLYARRQPSERLTIHSHMCLSIYFRLHTYIYK